MNEQESVDAESAYGSEISSNSNFIIKKETFKIEERTPKSQTRWQCLKYKLRDLMDLEAVFFLILIFHLIICYRNTSQNQETHKMILNIQSQLNSFQESTGNDFMKQIISQNQETQRMILSLQSQLNSFQNPTGRDVSNMKENMEEENESESKKTKAMAEEVLKEAQSQSIINNKSETEETHVPPIIPTVTSNSTLKRFNAASLIAGATVDKSLSSSSNLNPFIGFDQSDLVLVDRPEPPANKAWCTSDKNPVLTVNLGYYINPTAVSYQHSKWDGTIPDDAPKVYSVVGCLDNHCATWKSLFSNCEYNPHGSQEQFCTNVSNDSNNSPVGKIQFRFHENHGNTERTCVSSVRLYSETEVLPEQKLRRLEDTTTCIDLSHDYHHNPIKYKYFTYKNCHVLYSKGCCQECPECCEECEIQDINPEIIGRIIILAFALLMLSVPIVLNLYY